MNIPAKNTLAVPHEEVVVEPGGFDQREARDSGRYGQHPATADVNLEDDRQNDGTHRTHQHREDVSMFTALTEVLFNSFVDGYCNTPFCSEYYALPGCPSSGSPYTKPQHEPRDYYSTPSGKSYPDEEGGGSCSVGCDHFGNICKADSGASSSASRKKKVTNNQSLTRQRPLALAVGYGDYWKDNEGRRVVITSSRRQAGGRASPPHRTSPVTAGKVKLSPACTCGSGSHKRNNSILSSPEKESKHNVSPHQTKSVMCKLCADRLKNNRNLDPVVSSSHGAAAAAAITPQLV